MSSTRKTFPALRAASKGLKALCQGVIQCYRMAISPYLGARCRFSPSCSEYASEAIEHHGVCQGVMKTISRLLRCHPFAVGGYDPVSK